VFKKFQGVCEIRRKLGTKICGKRGEQLNVNVNTRVYPEVSGLAAWSENCKWYTFLPLSAVISLF
jgi:hypothetical protein